MEYLHISQMRWGPGGARALVLDALAAADALKQHAQGLQLQPRCQQRRLLRLPGRQRPQRRIAGRLLLVPPLGLRLALLDALRTPVYGCAQCGAATPQLCTRCSSVLGVFLEYASGKFCRYASAMDP